MAQAFLQWVSQWLWEKDPGFFRFKHAAKTILSILVTVLLLSQAAILVKLCAGMAAGFSTLGVVGERWRVKLTSLIIADVSFSLAYLIGALLKPYILWASLFLVMLSFLVMYVRRFGQRYHVFPLFVWVFGFLGTILPASTPSQVLHLSFMMWVGFSVAALIFLTIYSGNKQALFYDNVSQFFGQFFAMLNWLRSELLQAKNSSQMNEQIKERKQRLLQMVSLNEAIAQVQVGRSVKAQEQLLSLYVGQFALIKAASILLEAIEQVCLMQSNFSSEKNTELIDLLSTFSLLFSQLNINRRTGVFIVPPILMRCEEQLVDFKTSLLACDLDEKSGLVFLLNVQLGLRLMIKNLHKMERP